MNNDRKQTYNEIYIYRKEHIMKYMFIKFTLMVIKYSKMLCKRLCLRSTYFFFLNTLGNIFVLYISSLGMYSLVDFYDFDDKIPNTETSSLI